MMFGSLYSGIGGIDLGLERAGMSCAWQVEIDPFANRVLEKHWPNVPRFRDVKEVGLRELKRVQVIAGGFPCQDLSHAGKRGGLSAEKSGLWFEFRRIVAALLPDWAIIENVYQAWKKWVPFVRRELWGLGYASLPIRLRACDFGAPHLRARCFVVAHADGEFLRPELWGLGSRTRKTEPRDNGSTRIVADADRRGAEEQEGTVGEERGRASDGGELLADASSIGRGKGLDRLTGQEQRTDAAGSCAWSSEPDVGRVAHGVPNRAHRLRGLGNAVVPQKAEWIGRRIVALNESVHGKRMDEGK